MEVEHPPVSRGKYEYLVFPETIFNFHRLVSEHLFWVQSRELDSVPIHQNMPPIRCPIPRPRGSSAGSSALPVAFAGKRRVRWGWPGECH